MSKQKQKHVLNLVLLTMCLYLSTIVFPVIQESFATSDIFKANLELFMLSQAVFQIACVAFMISIFFKKICSFDDERNEK